MRIVFIDPVLWQYSIDTPYERPLGGSQSSLCYLAAELARLDHSVTILNGNSGSSISHNVRIRNFSAVNSPSFPNEFDVGIVLNAAIGRSLRRDGRMTFPLILWNQHAHDQPDIQDLTRLNERKSWSAFTFVSDWQRQNFEQVFWVQPEKSRVIRNCASPIFVPQPLSRPWFTTGEPPMLFYSSTPFRGLDVLLQAFPAIRAAIPGTRLRIFSSMGVYQVPAENDEYRALYDLARTIAGVEYVGSVGQVRLAKELSSGAALAYPSTFAETSCITVLEAMAAGAAVLTTRLGALPETTDRFASMIDWQSDRTALAESFAAMSIAVLRDMQQRPEEAIAQRNARIKHVNDNYMWPARAKEWSEWLQQLVRSHAPASNLLI